VTSDKSVIGQLMRSFDVMFYRKCWYQREMSVDGVGYSKGELPFIAHHQLRVEELLWVVHVQMSSTA